MSCHAGLPDAFRKRFNATIAQNIVVPPRHASLASFGMTEMGPKILPEVMDETIAQLPADLSGRMVIVGAGYAGKVIVQEAKKRGARRPRSRQRARLLDRREHAVLSDDRRGGIGLKSRNIVIPG